jgi:hypothetical protein
MKSVLLAAAVLLAPSFALAQDLSGAWNISSSVGTTPITIACTLAQKGEVLTGNCTPAGGELGPAVTGEVKGAKASWGYSVVFRGNPGTVAYEADVTSDSAMTGTLKLNGRPSPFTAVRK